MNEIKAPSGLAAFWRDHGKQVVGLAIIAIVLVSVWLSYAMMATPVDNMMEQPPAVPTESVAPDVDPDEADAEAEEAPEIVLPTGD